MFRTRAGDFRISSDVKIDDITKINVAHNDPSGTVEIEYDDGFTVDIASGSGSQRYWPGDWTDGVVFRFSTFTAYMTELEIQGMLSLRVDQLPPQLTKFSHDGGVFNVLDPLGSGQYVKFEGLTMGGKSLPTGLVDLHIENVRSPADVDRIIEALETNAQNNGSLFLAEQRLSKTAELLETRGWTVELEPQFAHKIERSKAPHTSVIDGKVVHHVDRRRGGDRRKQFEGRCVELNGTSEYATGPVLSGLTTQATWSVWVNTTALVSPGDYGAIIGAYNESTSDSQFVIDINNSTGGNGSVGFFVTRAGTFANYARVNSGALSSGVWHHIAAVFDNGTLHLYIDGVHQGAQTNVGTGVTDTLHATAFATRIGARSGALANYFEGKVYDPQIFDTALPATQIQALAEAGPQSLKPTLSSVPLIWLPMDDATSSPIIRNYGSLGSAGDFAITGTPSAVWSTQDRFSYPNAFGASAALVTNGVDSYVDTGVTLNGATAFSIFARRRHLSTSGYDLDGFEITGVNNVRIGRNTGSAGLYIDPGGTTAVTVGGSQLPDGAARTLSLTSQVGGNYVIKVANAQVSSGTAASVGYTSAITNTTPYSYNIGRYNRASPGHYSHTELYEYLIANRVLTDDELTWLETYGASGTPIDFANDPNIVLYYRFDQPHPRIVHNYADPGNPGKIVGDCEWIAVNHDPANPTLDMNGKALTWKGQVPRDAVISSPAVELNGTSEFVTVPHSPLFNFGDSVSDSPFSVSAWVNIDAHGANKGAILSKASNVGAGTCEWLLQCDASGLLGLYLYDDTTANQVSFTATDAIPTGEAVHVVGTYDGSGSESGIRLYVNGISVSGTASEVGTYVAMHATSTPVQVGRALQSSIYISRLDGTVFGAKIFDSELSPSQVVGLYQGALIDGIVLGLPMCESSGTICWDVSGNGNHGTGAPTARTGSQHLSDHLITNGYAKGTHFDGASDYWSGPKLLKGSASWSIGCFLCVDSLAASSGIVSQYLTTGNQREFQWFVFTDGSLRCNISGTGTAAINVIGTPSAVTAGKLHHVAIAVDGPTASAKFFVDGVDVTQAVGSVPSALFDGTATISIGSTNTAGGSHLAGTLSQLLIHDGVYWSADNVAAIRAAGTTAEIKAIVDNLGGTAWYFQDGNSEESLQGVTSGWTTNGAPEERVIPAGAGVPITYGPGIAAPGQDRLVAAEPNSPFALRYAGDYSLGAGDLVHEAVFPGSTNRVDLGSILIGATDDFDISFDFKADVIASEFLFTQWTDAIPGRMYITLVDNGSVEFYVQGSLANVQITSLAGLVTAGRWHTVRATRVGDAFTLYFDGVQVGTQTRESISIEQVVTRLGTSRTASDDFTGKIRNVRIDNNGTLTERLTRGIALPGATLTNVTVSSKEYGAIGGRILFQKPDGTANLYETSMSAEMADIIASRKYY